MNPSKIVWLIPVGVVLVAYMLMKHVQSETPLPNVAKETLDKSMRSRPCAFETAWGSAFELLCYTYYPNWPKTHIALPVHVYHAEKRDKQSTPILYLPGGPGEMLTTDESMHHLVEPWLEAGDIARDFILIDFRGNLPGQPHEPCPEYLREVRRLFGKSVDFTYEAKALLPVLAGCLERFAYQFDPSLPSAQALAQLNTRQNAEDTRAVMRALNYEQWHLAGVSYGTRVALQAASTQTEVQQLILDSVYTPVEGQSVSEITGHVSAFERFFHYCDTPGQCVDTDNGVSVEQLFWQAVERLQVSALEVRSLNWGTDQNDSWVLTSDRLVAMVFYNLYTATHLRIIPQLLNEILDERVSETILLEGYYNAMMDPFFNDLVFYTTECHDNPLSSPDALIEAFERLGPWQSLLGPLPEQDICLDLALTTPDESMSQATLKQRTLVVAGALDPVTSLPSAKKYAEGQRNIILATLPHHAHAEFFWDHCGAEIIEPFLAAELLGADQVESQLRTCMERGI